MGWDDSKLAVGKRDLKLWYVSMHNGEGCDKDRSPMVLIKLALLARIRLDPHCGVEEGRILFYKFRNGLKASSSGHIGTHHHALANPVVEVSLPNIYHSLPHVTDIQCNFEHCQIWQTSLWDLNLESPLNFVQ